MRRTSSTTHPATQREPRRSPHITERAQQVARDAVEAHGGIGFTWECDVQIWLKRILFDRAFLGTPERQRERSAALGGF
ncbi:MAG: acyl-CoA dehydrogenase family protein [Myxococcota bacterium]